MSLDNKKIIPNDWYLEAEKWRKKMSELKRCPCGEIPDQLSVAFNGQGAKWATASGDCCGFWEVEFRTEYESIESDKCNQFAQQAWNDAKRHESLL